MLAVGLASALAIALVYGARESSVAAPSQPPTREMPPAEPEQAAQDFTGELPPGHPPIGGSSDMDPAPNDTVHAGPEDERAALTWKAPPTWTLVPNPNGMRLATYKLSGDTELVVARAGGDVAGNVKRWEGQFDESHSLKESHKTVRGLKVTVVEIDGTFKGGMSGSAGDHEGWTMLGAIVETEGQPYFFKIVGPKATVHAAEKPFDGVIDSLTPA